MKHPAFRNSMFLVALIVLGASVAIYAYLYTPTGALVSSALAERGKLQDSEQLHIQGLQIVALEASTSASRAEIRSYFVPADNAVAVIQSIESIGKSSGAVVSISSINSSDPDSSTHIGHVAADVSISGSWTSVTRAFALFEALPYDRTMNGLTLHAEGDKDGTWQASFRISVATLASPEPSK